MCLGYLCLNPFMEDVLDVRIDLSHAVEKDLAIFYRYKETFFDKALAHHTCALVVVSSVASLFTKIPLHAFFPLFWSFRTERYIKQRRCKLCVPVYSTA